MLFRNAHGSLSGHYVLEGLDAVRHRDSIRHLSLYLDATKARMLFAQRLILVEGISEQILIPRLFELYYQGRQTLESIGATVLNVNGVAFTHFLRLVRNGYFLKCAVLTDQDTGTRNTQRAQKLRRRFEQDGIIRVCITKHSTFEKDLICANSAAPGKQLLLAALKEVKPIKGKTFAESTGTGDIPVDYFFSEIENHKAEFAFSLARLLRRASCKLNVPEYITSAFEFLK